jgi:Fe-S-cluster-containing dehydrogenase component/CRP-like cAMP-binding protein
METRPRGDAWPAIVFDTPVLRGLDARAEREIMEAGALRELDEGAPLYRAGDEGASFFVVAAGRVALRARKRGDERESELRSAGAGESFGEECTVGLGRHASATASEAALVAEIPVHIFRRAAGRSGKAEIAERLERGLRRSATRDLLRTLAFTRDLPPRDLDVLLDAVTHVRVARGQTVYRQGDLAAELFLIADGLVQIQSEDGERVHVRAYLSRGDFFGDEELGRGDRRASSAVASGPALLLSLPAKVVRELSAAHPDLLSGLRRIAADQQAAQQLLVGAAAKNATQHVFRDLYRLQVARSLLVIDLESCVRCGHCAWACSEMYGTARLVRRGDKMVAQVETELARPAPAAPKSLMLPNSCQHCEHPACMVDCPTGAIGRDPAGEVFIREELCTGCGACAKACPWDNIQMAVRPFDARRPLGAPGEFGELAVKCDLCRTYEAPACVQSCPTESIFRINPAEEIADVRALFRGEGPEATRAAKGSGAPLVAGAAIASLGVGLVGVIMHGRGLWWPTRGLGLYAGLAAALTMLLLLAYALPKRGVRLWMKRREKAAEGAAPKAKRAATSVTRPQLSLHLALGLFAPGLALAHAPWSSASRQSLGGALLATLVTSSIAGAFTALAYTLIPARLARLERTAALPEDFTAARRELHDRLYREVSGKSELVKKLFERVLLPYVQSKAGPLLLVLSGRRLREEERALRERIDLLLEGRGKERLAGLAELIKIVVELRSLPAQRWLLRTLRVGLPLHIVTFGLAAVLLALHVVFAVYRLR